MSYISYRIKAAVNGVIVEVEDPTSRMYGGFDQGRPYIFSDLQEALLFINEKEEQIARTGTLIVENV